MQDIFFCCLSLSVVVFGCGPGDGKPKIYPVTGKVSVKGQPAGGRGLFSIQRLQTPWKKSCPCPLEKQTTRVNIQLQSYVPNDGAPEGDYKVTIVWPEPPPANAMGIFDQKDRWAVGIRIQRSRD